jgi:hypothetical protein
MKTANKADLLAEILVNQKLISKYEQIPTPSQPTNKWNRLEEVTRRIMKKTNNEMYEKNLIICGSSLIYSTE